LLYDYKLIICKLLCMIQILNGITFVVFSKACDRSTFKVTLQIVYVFFSEVAIFTVVDKSSHVKFSSQ